MDTPRTTIVPEPNTAYVWEVPGKPVAVHLELDVIDQMMPAILRGFGAMPRRGLEVGGILLGTIAPGEPVVVHVTGFEVTPCEHGYGPSFLLSDRDMKAWRHAYSRARPSPEKAACAVGYFRSHTRDGLALADEDMALMAEFFPPPAIALLVKPFASKASQAGLFIYEDGYLRAEESYLEFPFRSSELSTAPVDPSATLILPQREREFAVQPSVEAAVPEVSAEEVSATRPRTLPEPRRTSLTRTWAEDNSAPDFTAAEPASADSSWARWPVAIAIGLLLLLMGAAAGFQYALNPQAPQGWFQANPYALALSANPVDDNIHLTWNRQARSIRAAKRALLTITDGAAQQHVELPPEQLLHGSLVYRHVSGAVTFKLEVFLGERSSVAETLQLQLPNARLVPSPAPRPGVPPEPDASKVTARQ
jgi:hypothetical protein